jgi:hypothetical protein
MNKSMILVTAISAILFVSPVCASDDDDNKPPVVVTPVVANPNSVVNNNALNSTVTNTVTNTNTNNLSQSQRQDQNQQQNAQANSNATATGNGSGNATSITQNYQDSRPVVASAYSGSLTSGLDTCLGSVSAGIQTQIVGVSGGKTIVDKNCVMIKQVQLLVQLGYPTAACFRARQDFEIDEAMKAAGIECYEPPLVTAPQAPTDVNPEDPSHPGVDIKSLYK